MNCGYDTCHTSYFNEHFFELPIKSINYRFTKVFLNMLSIAYFPSDFQNVGTYLLERASGSDAPQQTDPNFLKIEKIPTF